MNVILTGERAFATLREDVLFHVGNRAMSISVPPEFEPFIRQQVAAGKYPTEEAVVSAALELLERWERKLAALREELRPALEAIDRGEGVELSEGEWRRLFAELDAELNEKRYSKCL